jgi:mutual gliding-motility protein MglA
MVLINKAINEVTVKLVYYGPGLCGKTTNLEKIYANPKLDNKGKMISMSTETDRTLFFDFMPMELGTIAGQKVRVQLYTVPGQVFYDATRKLVLRGADGVVFVADSQPSMRDSNVDSLENLKANLRLNRIDPEKIAIVYQYNKRDLANPSPVEEMTEYLKPGNAPVVEAVAINGSGVTATLRAAVARILDNLKNNVDTTIHENPPLAKPDMSEKAGVNIGAAAAPKLSMKGQPAPPAEEQPVAALPPSPLTQQAPFVAAGASSASIPAEASMASPFHSPFDVEEAAPPFDPSNFAAVIEEEDPFGQAAESVAVDPFTPSTANESADIFAIPAQEDTDERVRLETLLASSREVVVSLEAALERARENERTITEMLEGR